MSKVVLDLDTFKALASESRLSVLRALGKRRMTLSELARDLDLNKATVHEHLQVLVASGLVKKMDEGRKWIYYELTWRGQNLLNPEASTAFSVLLALSVAAAGGGVAMLGQALGFWWQENQLRDRGEGARLPAADNRTTADDAAAGAEKAPSQSAQGEPSGEPESESEPESEPGSEPQGDADADPPPESGEGGNSGDQTGEPDQGSQGATSAEPAPEPTPAPDPPAQAEGMELAPAPQDEASDGGAVFFDDGGWIALALLGAAALFLLMAILIRTRRPPRGKVNTQTET